MSFGAVHTVRQARTDVCGEGVCASGRGPGPAAQRSFPSLKPFVQPWGLGDASVCFLEASAKDATAKAFIRSWPETVV